MSRPSVWRSPSWYGARTADGEPLQYSSEGRGGAPMLLYNGLVSSTQHWCYFIPRFAERSRVVSWDYRGHGGLPAPKEPSRASVEQFASDAEQVSAAAVGQEPVIGVGLSFGVQVALEHYRLNPGRFRGLVLICGVEGHPLDRVSPRPALRRGASTLVRTLLGNPALSPLAMVPVASPRLVRHLAYLTGGAHRELCPPEILDDIFRHSASLPPALIAAAASSFFEHSAADVLEQISVPTLLIAGDRDQFAPLSRMAAMRDRIPTARLDVFPGHTHLVQLERPDDVHVAIERFLDDSAL